MKKAEPPGYQYRAFPDWGAGFIWYDTAWYSTPEGEYCGTTMICSNATERHV